jgi:hypothetical protein
MKASPEKGKCNYIPYLNKIINNVEGTSYSVQDEVIDGAFALKL